MNDSQTNLLYAICQNIPDAICMIDRDWNVQSWNNGAVIMFGYTADEIIGKSLALIIPEDIFQKEIDHCIGELDRSGKLAAYETVRRTKDGRIIPIELTAVVLKDDGEVVGYASIMRDISERINSRKALEESEETLRTIFNAMNDAILVHDIETGRILEVNEKFYDMYGYTADDVPRLDVQSISAGTAGYTNAEAFRLLQDAAAGKPQFFQWMARNRTGRSFPVDVNLRRVSLKGRDRILATVRDISDRKRAEEDLKLTRFSVEHASVSVFLIGPDARILYVNEETCRSLGYTRDELLAMTVHDVDPHFPAARWTAHWAELRKEHTLRFETEHRRKNGTLVPVDVSTNYVSFGGREYNWAFASDMTAHKQAEQVLRESEERYRSIVETSTDWICEMDLQGRLSFNNPAVENILGYRPDELLGANSFDLLYEEDRDSADRVVRQAIADRQGWRKCLQRWKHRDGSVRFIESNSTPIFSGSGDLTGFRGSNHDLTELMRAEEQLRAAYADLEEKVRVRTRELAQANEELQMEVTERRHAVDQIRKAKELSDALNSLDAVIHSMRDFDEIMQRVVKESAEALDVDASMIGVYEGAVFRVRYVHNMPESFTGRTLTARELRAIHHVALAGDALVFNDAFNDERLNIPFVRSIGIRSLLVAPLFIKKKITGALTFYGLSRQIIFGEDHLSFARKLSASISLALENAELYQELSESERISTFRLDQLRTIYETAPVGLCFLDREKRYVSINRRLADINSLPIEEHIGRSINEVITDRPAARAVDEMCERVFETGNPVENVEILRKADTGLTVLANYYPIKDAAGNVLGLNIVVQDITQRKRAEEAIRRNERLLNALLNSIPDMAWLKDKEGRFILVNDPFVAASGKPARDLIGRTDREAWPPGMAERYQTDDQEVMERGEPKRVEEPLVASDGSIRWIETIKTPIRNDEGAVVGTVGVARDMTERRRMEEEIRHMAQHDALTGLPNRRMFIDILNLEMAQSRRHQTKLAVLFLDLDRFKEVNDTLGHDAGDRLLKIVAARLRGAIRESDTVARIGGDEFNMVLSDLNQVEDVSEVALKIVESVAQPVAIAGHELHVTTSVGISVYPDDGLKVDTLLRYADIAMYHAKESGRNTFRFYNPSINVRSLERMKLDSYLRQSITRNELTVHYQPQIDIRSNTIRYAEALVRWNHPDRGFLEPKEFIPLAEETGFITSIDEWVLRAVCMQAGAWKRAGIDSFCVTVNLSTLQFQSPELVNTIKTILDETGMSPGCLDIEITESLAMRNVERSAAQLRELRDMGVHISVDDFGTGYSSLNYLKKLPIERLKIDKSFIRDIATDSDDRAIISAVTSMAHKMGIRTVAEGVETEEQLSFLREADCDEAQGFLFSRPVPPDKFRELIEAGR